MWKWILFFILYHHCTEHGIKKTLEVLSTEVMSHIRENKDDFYSSFKSVSKSENESENLIECCARYFQGAAYNTNSVDVCIAAIVKTLGVNLKPFPERSSNEVDDIKQV